MIACLVVCVSLFYCVCLMLKLRVYFSGWLVGFVHVSDGLNVCALVCLFGWLFGCVPVC